MKYGFYTLLIGCLLVACKKDKLEGETSILEGKWKWSYSSEFIHNNFTGANTMNIRQASEFNDAYYIEFARKGKVKFLKNDDIEEENRVVFSIFRNENCEFINCKRFSIYLDNKENNKLTGFINQDTMGCAGQSLPLSMRTEGDLEYTYNHYYLRAN